MIIPSDSFARGYAKPVRRQKTFTRPVQFGRNEDQIVLTSFSRSPYIKGSGVSEFVPALAEGLRKHGKDARVFMAPQLLPYETTRVHIDRKGHMVWDGLELKPTGIEADIRYGVFQEKATLYELRDPERDIPTYIVFTPSMVSRREKMRALDKQADLSASCNFDHFASRVAFQVASVTLEEALRAKSSFDPKVIHGQNPTFEFAVAEVDKVNRTDSDPLMTLYTQHVDYAKDHPRHFIPPIFIALATFSEDELRILRSDGKIQSSMAKLGLPGSIGTLEQLADSWDFFSEGRHNKGVMADINKRVQELFPEKGFWVQHKGKYAYHDLLNLLSVTSWNAISSPQLQNTLDSLGEYNPSFKPYIVISNGIDYRKHSPKSAEFPFNWSNFTEERFKNKLLLQQRFRQDAIGAPEHYGYLNAAGKDTPMLFMVCRPEIETKGLDIAFSAIKQLKREGYSFQSVFVIPGITHSKDARCKAFIEQCENASGDMVIVDQHVNPAPYFAGADIFLFPSRYDAFGNTLGEAIRMGAVTVGSPVGAAADFCDSVPYRQRSMFLTRKPLSEEDKPIEAYTKVLKEALGTYSTDPETWSNMVRGNLWKDLSWETASRRYADVYQSLGKPLGESNPFILPSPKK